jgi:rod shape determining protein RodA
MALRNHQLGPKILTDIDWWLVFATLLLAGLGILEIFSAQPGQEYWSRQVLSVMLGLVAMLGVAIIDYHRISEGKWVFYGLALALLVLVLFVGREVNGARAWFRFAGFSFQPSELAKLATIVALATYLAKVGEEKKSRRENYLTLREIAIATGIVLLPVGLIMLEPDQGTALTFLPMLAGMLFVKGIRPRWIVTSLVLMALFVGAGWHFRHHFLKTYQIQRIEAVIHPDRVDPRGFGYQTKQSTIAVGSGGPWGRGVTRGAQSRLKFLPQPHTDFIASVVAEEMGFLGMFLVLGLYWVIIMRAISHARRSPDHLGMLIITGVVTLLGFHITANIGMVVGLLPIMGIPLPLLSYGGSSIITTFIAVGLVASIRFHRHVN